MAITYALMQRLEELVESDPERVQVIKKAKVTSLRKEGNSITGCTYEFNGEPHTVDGAVVLATGGYAADFSETSLLKKWRPDTFHLSSTNGTHATGDGHKMLMAIGANDIDMDKVQVHPTGLVDPKDPDSKWKFLAAEALRGEGGLLLNSDGQRFSDELGHRDYVSGEMWKEKEKKKWPIRLVLNSKASNVLDFHTRHYSGRGLMKKMSGAELAKEIGCGEAALAKTFTEYNEIADGKRKDPFGKKYFHNLPFNVNDTFHVALMEPVLHFTMGGIEINDKAEVLNGEKSLLKVSTHAVSSLVASMAQTGWEAPHSLDASCMVAWPGTPPPNISSRKSSLLASPRRSSGLVRFHCTLTLLHLERYRLSGQIAPVLVQSLQWATIRPLHKLKSRQRLS